MRAGAASFHFVAGTAPAATTRHQVFGRASDVERRLRLEKAWRQKKTWWKAGGTYVLYMGMVKRSPPWIVVHIPRNFEGGKASLTESPLGRLEFKLSRIRLTGSAELRSECYLGMVLFG
jgi:hypothetical protein